MKRPFLYLLLTALASAVPFACTAKLDESCLSGPCEADVLPAGSTAASTGASGGGEGGAGGAGGVGGAGGSAPVVCDPSIPTTGEFPCDVWDVLVARCHECHTNPTKNGAPFPLLTFENTRESYGSKLKWEYMQIDIKSGYMPFNKPDDLMGAELKTMQDWFAACAPPVPDGMGCEMK